MRFKTRSIFLCVVMVINIFCVIPQNAGTSISYLYGTEELEIPFTYNFSEPSPSSAGTSGLADSPWPMFRQNLNRTGHSPYDTSGNPGKLKWNFTTGGRVSSSAAIGSDGIIYVGSWDNNLYAINPDGTEKWNFETGYRIGYSSPTIGSDGTIYVGSYDQKLYAINPNGLEKWNFTTGNFICSSPTIGSDGTIYVGSYDQKLYAINPNGSEKWNFTTDNQIGSSPTIDSDGTIYVGSFDHKLYAINPDGSEKWNFITGDDIYSSPMIGFNGTIYVGSFDNNLYAINPDGSEKWNFMTNNSIYSSPALGSDGTIFIGSYDNNLYAINPDGTEKWNFSTGNTIHSSPAIGSDGVIYIGSDDKKMYAINPNGTEKWNLWIGKPIYSSSPAIDSDGTIYIGSWDGKLYAIGTHDIPPIANAGTNQTVNEGEVVQFDGSSSYDPDGTIVSYEWDFESDGVYDYLETSSNAPDGVFDGMTTNIYGDDGVYTATLRVTDDGGESDTDSCDITVSNIEPAIDSFGPFSANEGSQLNIKGTATDLGSDDLTFTWNWGDGTSTVVNTHYNDGTSPEPLYDSGTNEVKSPLGTHPFSATDSVSHTYGDDGVYTVTLTVSDDDGGETSYETTVTVNNAAPVITLMITYPDDEGSQVTFKAEATDVGSDDLTYSWELEFGPTIENTYYNDGVGPELVYDPISNEVKSPMGTYPFYTSDVVTHIYGDDHAYTIILTVTDDDGGETTYTSTVGVYNLAPSISRINIPSEIDEDSSATFEAEVEDQGSDDLTFTWEFELGPTITNIHYNDGTGPDPDPSPHGTYPFLAADSVEHTYGDNGKFSLTLTIEDDDDGVTTYTTSMEVNNVAPIIEFDAPSPVDENSPVSIIGHATDFGSDDLIFTWDWGDGTSDTVTIYYNDGTSPDPYPSPEINPMNITDVVTHTYGDNGDFPVTLTVEDDDGDLDVKTTTVTVNNVLPSINPGGPYNIIENSPITLTATITDPGSDDLTIAWDWGDGFSSTITSTYFNDGISPDPFPSPEINPMSIMESQTHTYGDDGVFTVTVTALDDDNGETISTVDVEVKNVNPVVEILEAYMHANFSLRVAGEKWHSVNINLYEDGSEIWAASVTRYPGDPDEQKATISNVKVDMTKSYTALVDYIPNDPRINGNVWGANPVWIDMEFEDGSIKRLHHTFNVRKSYWDSEHWNHIDPWEVELNPLLLGHNITLEAQATDPGSDDLIFTWDFGDGGTAGPNTYFNNGMNPDPYPSPEINPMNAIDNVVHAYTTSSIFTVTLTVIDDDGGTTTTTLVIVLPG